MISILVNTIPEQSSSELAAERNSRGYADLSQLLSSLSQLQSTSSTAEESIASYASNHSAKSAQNNVSNTLWWKSRRHMRAVVSIHESLSAARSESAPFMLRVLNKLYTTRSFALVESHQAFCMNCQSAVW